MTAPSKAERDELRARHRRFTIYSECEHKEHEDSDVRIELDDFYGCPDSVSYYICEKCCTDGDYQSEACIDGHSHAKGDPICDATRLLDALDEADRRERAVRELVTPRADTGDETEGT